MLGVILLIATIAASGAAGAAATRWVGEPRRSVATAVALAYLMVVPSLGCRVGLSFITSLGLATVAAAALAVVMRRYRAPTPADDVPDSRPYLWALILGLVSLVAIVWCQLNNHFWDENQFHIGVSNNIARGRVPPEHPMFPHDPLRYHYGFNALVAILRVTLHLRIELAIDVVSILCFALILWLSADVGGLIGSRTTIRRRRVGLDDPGPAATNRGSRLGASLALILFPMGSSLPQAWVYPNIMGPLELRSSWIPAAWLDMYKFPPPVIHNFFQKPQALGMIFVLACLLLFDFPSSTSSARRNTARRRVLAVLVLAGASLGQFVFFCVLGVGLGAWALVRAWREASSRSLPYDLGGLLVALVFAMAIGGFFDTQGTLTNQIRWGERFFNEPLVPAIFHHLLSFGLPLLVLPYTYYRAVRNKDALLATVSIAATAGFIVPNLMVYARSWDVVKFFNAASFLCNIALVDALVVLWATRPNALTRPVAVAAAVSTAFTGWYFLARVSFLDGRWGITPMKAWIPGPPPMTHVLSEELGPLIPPGDRVLSTNIEIPYAGFLCPGFDWRVFAPSMLIDRNYAERMSRAHMNAKINLDREALATLEVKWLSLGPGDIISMSPRGRERLNDARVFKLIRELPGHGGGRKIFRYYPELDGKPKPERAPALIK